MAVEGAELMFVSAGKFCTFCFKRVGKSEKLKQHICNHLESLKFKCKNRSKVYRSKYDLNIHQKVKHEDFMFICEFDSCSKKIKNSTGLNAHRRKEHTVINDYLYDCPSCNNGFDHKVKFVDQKYMAKTSSNVLIVRESLFTCQTLFYIKGRERKLRYFVENYMKCKPTKRFLSD